MLFILSLNKKGFLKLTFITILFLGLIIAWLGFGRRGFIHLYQMEKKRQAYVEIIQNLKKNNQKLLEEIKRLRTDKEYIESIARKELGLIKDNEIFYRFTREKGDNPSTEVEVNNNQ